MFISGKNKCRFLCILLFSLFLTIQLPMVKIVKAKELDNTLTKVNIEKMADTFFNSRIEKKQIPGAVLVVVKDGKILFKKGYGYANINQKSPVNPDTTVFRVGSVSKLFTETAIMQLKQHGKIDFTKDINTYLKDIKIKNPYPAPITIENLLTHTAGFDENTYEGDLDFSNDVDASFIKNIKKYKNDVIREPGQVIQYSNYGICLAGYIVSQVTGEKFSDYIEKHILKPLKMECSSFKMTPPIIENMAQGYYYADGKYNSVKLYTVPGLPDGGLNATGSDMGNFMIAHLQKGNFESTNILSEKSVLDMHSQHFSMGKTIDGVCYGFFENSINGYRTLEHSGSEPGFSSVLKLLPDKNVGYFISINEDAYTNDVAKLLLSDFPNEFMNHFYPRLNNTAPSEYKFSPNELKEFTGIYRETRYPLHSIGKIAVLLGDISELEASTTKSNIILHKENKSKEFIPINSSEFKQKDSNMIAAFKKDKTGNIHYLALGSEATYSKISWYETNLFHRTILLAMLLIFLVQIIFYIKSFFLKEHKKNCKGLQNIKRLSTLISLCNVIFCIGILLYFLSLKPDCFLDSFGLETLIHSLFIKIWLILPFVSIIFTVLLLCLLIKNSKIINIVQRLCYSLLFLCSAGFIFFLNYWCLLGYRF